MPIWTFADRNTQIFFETGKLRKKVQWHNIRKMALRKLDMLHYAVMLDDLKSPPGNRLELLKGNLRGFYSIRINEKWRIIFRWGRRGPEDVSIADYH